MTKAERVAMLIVAAIARQSQAINNADGLREVSIILHVGRGQTPDQVEVKFATRTS